MASRRKDPYYHRGEPGLWSKLLKILAVLAVIAVVFSIPWALTRIQPRKLTADDPALAPIGKVLHDVSTLLDQSKALEKNFTDAAKVRDITPEDLTSLRHAIQLQIDYLDQSHNRNLSEGNDRIARMTATLETYESKPLRDQSLDLESKAENLASQKDYDGARKLFAQAAGLEDKIINTDDKGENYTSAVSRSIQFRHRVDYLTALPLDNDSKAAEDAANLALTHQDWVAAQQNFQKAHDLQQRLNEDFPQQSFANADRQLRLQQQITALRSLPEYQRVEKSLADAQAADTAGDALKAAQFYQDAYREQSDLNNHFPDSRFADAKQLAIIQAQLETSQSRPLATDIKTQAAALFDDLRHRHADQAHNNIANIQQKAAHFHEAFPHSNLLEADFQKRLDYLYYKRDDLAAIQNEVYALLLPLPGQKYWQLAKTEVTQSLYNAVAGGNPSRNPGEKLPVEMVNWTEAQDFCQRLSWILARPVRLPTADEYRTALGSTDALDLAATTWNFDNSGSQTHEAATKTANANGFYDLLGNVAEWLERPFDADDGQAPVIGSTALTPVDNIRAVRVNNIALETRNPFTGFRFMVNADDSLPVVPAPPPAAPVKKISPGSVQPDSARTTPN